MSVVLDASAVLALVRDEPGADRVAPHVGRAAISAVNLQEVVEELLLSGLEEATIRELLDELRLDVRTHDVDAAMRAAGLRGPVSGCGPGDRCCMALAIRLGIPALTTDREWRRVKVEGLEIEHIR